MILSKNEINLIRLLDRSQKLVDQVVVNYSSNTPISFQMDKFKSSITYMHTLLSTLEREKCDQLRLSEFKERIEMLASLVHENSAFIKSKATIPRDNSMLSPTDKLAETDRISKIKKIAQDELRNELLTNDPSSPAHIFPSINTTHVLSSSSSGDQNSPPKSISPVRTHNTSTSSLEVLMTSSIRNRSRTARHELMGSPELEESTLPSLKGDSDMLLLHNKQVQEELTEQLAQMAMALKSNTVSFGEQLKKDKTALDDLDRGMESSLSRLKSEASRLGALNMSSRSSTCLVIFIVLFVCIVFLSAIFFMRFFRLQ